MTDVIEGMARAIEDALCGHRGVVMGPGHDACVAAAQAALDYLKQPQTASKPLPEGQGPEMTQEQIQAMWVRMQPVWQPLIDSLIGKAP